MPSEIFSISKFYTDLGFDYAPIAPRDVQWDGTLQDVGGRGPFVHQSKHSLTYLASPHHHANPVVSEWRFRMAAVVTGILLRAGRLVYSPIAHTHEVAKYAGFSGQDFSFYERFDLAVIDRCTDLIVLNLPGLEKSVGCLAEMQYALAQSKRIVKITPSGELANAMWQTMLSGEPRPADTFV